MSAVISIPWSISDLANHLHAGFNENILFADVGVPGEYCLLFCHKQTMRRMNQSREVFSSITQAMAAQTCCYIYQISCYSNKKIVPMVQVLMLNTEYESFRNVFLKLQQEFPEFTPYVAYLTMVKNERTAWLEVYSSLIRDKFLDYIQKTKVSFLKLHPSTVFQPSASIRVLLRSLLGLPLLPPSYIELGFFNIVKQSTRSGNLKKISCVLLDMHKRWIRTNRLRYMMVHNSPFKANNLHIIANNMLTSKLKNFDGEENQFQNAIQDYGEASYQAASAFHGQGYDTPGVVTLQDDQFIKNCTKDLLNGHLSIRRFLRVTSSHVLRLFYSDLRT